MAVPLTREELREDLLALSNDFQRALRKLEEQVTRPGRWPQGKVTDKAGTLARRQPHQWVQRHMRSFAVSAELQETYQGVREERSTTPSRLGGKAGRNPVSMMRGTRRAHTDVGKRSRVVQQLTASSGGSGQVSAHVDLSSSEGAWGIAVNGAGAGLCGEVPSSESSFSSGVSPAGVLAGSQSWRSNVVAEQTSLTAGQPLRVIPDSSSGVESGANAPRRRGRWARLSSTFNSLRSGPIEPFPPARHACVAACQTIVHSACFEYLVVVLVISNAVTIGMQTDHMARTLEDSLPREHHVVELLFTSFFVLELLMRLVSDGFWFFLGPARMWNVLDLFIVSVQVVEEFLLLLSVSTNLPFSLSLIRMLRFLRLVRVIRVMRLLRYITELRTIVCSLMNSAKPLLSSIVLMLLVVYIVGIYLTQLVVSQRVAEGCSSNDDLDAASGSVCDDAALTNHYGNVATTMLALFMSVTGGLEWAHMVRPLITHISPFMGLLYALYIIFTALALMNIVTGVFVETALARGREDKDIHMINHLRDLFHVLDLNRNGFISWSELSLHLDNSKLQTFLKEIDLDVSEAGGLFRLLDKDSSGLIYADDFLSGCVRLRGPAKALDMQLLMRELAELREVVNCMASTVSAEPSALPPPPGSAPLLP